MNTKFVYVVGSNVDKSLSPLIFNHWFKKYKIKAQYGFINIKTNNLSKTIKKTLKEKNVVGINVTIPFKEKVIKNINIMDRPSKIIGAVNCITPKKNKYYGANTDWLGFGDALQKKQKISTKDKVLIIGYGGAAKAILYFFLKKHNKKTFVFNRTSKKINLLNHHQKKTLPLKLLKNHIKDADLIINTIPKNIFKDLGVKKITKKLVVCDIVYKPKKTNFIKHFTNPKKIIYGIDMLLYQAIPCFKRWFGFTPTIDSLLVKKISKEISK